MRRMRKKNDSEVTKRDARRQMTTQLIRAARGGKGGPQMRRLPSGSLPKQGPVLRAKRRPPRRAKRQPRGNEGRRYLATR